MDRSEVTATATGILHAARLAWWMAVHWAACELGDRALLVGRDAAERADRAEADLERVTGMDGAGT